MKSKPSKIYKNDRGQTTGFIRDGVLEKDVKGSVHMLRNPQGWAWDTHVIHDALNRGVEETVILDTEDGFYYAAPLQAFLDDGWEFDRGFGRQTVLGINRWQKWHKSQERPVIPTQLRMFP